MEIEVSLTPLEIDGKERPISDERRVVVRPSWNTRGDCVDLVVSGARYKLSRAQLEAALRACAQDH